MFGRASIRAFSLARLRSFGAIFFIVFGNAYCSPLITWKSDRSTYEWRSVSCALLAHEPLEVAEVLGDALAGENAFARAFASLFWSS